MGGIISSTNKKNINENWNQLKCSPIGPFLQMTGLAPGDVNETSRACQNQSFSSQFNTSMTDQVNATNKLNSGMNSINGTMNKMKAVLANIQQKIFEDLSKIATLIFSIYVKIGNIIMVINKNLKNILNVFKNFVNTAVAVMLLLMSFINLIRVPVNGLIRFVKGFGG